MSLLLLLFWWHKLIRVCLALLLYDGVINLPSVHKKQQLQKTKRF